MHGYIGSVRFFKNLILLAVIVMIAVPSAFAGYYRHAYTRLKAEQTETEELHQDVEVLMQKEDEPQESDEPQPEALSVDVPEYQNLYPDFYAPQPLEANERVENTIYLTFDDGPSEYTDKVLDTLAAKGVKGTFYLVGTGHTDAKSLERMRRIVAEGHSIGMHSYTHDYNKIYSSVEAYLDDMYQIFTLIKETTGVTPTLFRFPGGSINSHNRGIYQELTSEMLRRGFIPCDWNLSSGDAAGGHFTEAQLVQNVVGSAGGKKRGVVLMHDTKQTTANALGSLIDQLKALGFDFAPLTVSTSPVLYTYESNNG